MHRKDRSILFGNIRSLYQTYAQIRIRYFRRKEQIDRDPVFFFEIDTVVQLGKVFHTGTGAAPEFILRRPVHLIVSACHRLEIHRHTGLGILRREDRVDQRVFIILRILLIPGDHKELAGHLQHIESVTGLVIAVGTLGIQDIIFPEMLPLTVTAGCIGMMLRDQCPEFFRVFQILRITDRQIAV